MFLLRWLPTFVAFPIGGWIAVTVVGSIDGPGTAASAGLIAGALVGAAQWLALRSVDVSVRWVLLTAATMAIGSSVSAVITDAGTSVEALVVSGLVTGAAVGAGQATVLACGPRASLGWIVVVSLSWGLGWLVTANVIVDAERGYAAFGSSGAIVVTVATGLALRPLLRSRARVGAADLTSQVS